MKIKIKTYAFDKTAKTVTFGDYASIKLDGILLITNVTRNIIIYNFANPALGGTVATNVLTLAYDTSAMVSGNGTTGDKLMIMYEDDTMSLWDKLTTMFDSFTTWRDTIQNIVDTNIVPASDAVLSIAGMQIPKFDEIVPTYPTTSTELYTYKLATVTVATVLVTYSDATKAVLTNVLRTL